MVIAIVSLFFLFAGCVLLAAPTQQPGYRRLQQGVARSIEHEGLAGPQQQRRGTKRRW
jgi:hypothetical protein